MTTSVQQSSAFNRFELYLIFLPPDIIIDALSLVADRLAKKIDDLAKVWALEAS